MLRKLEWLAAIVTALCLLSGCTETKVLHCGHYGKDVTVSETSNMEEERILYCTDCNEELFGYDPILGNT